MQNDINVLPVRGSDVTEILVNDHQIIKRLLTQLTQSGAGIDRQETLEELKAALTIHNATEENIVYPALHAVAGKKSEAEHLYHETATADVLVFKLDTMLKEGDESGFPALAEKLKGAIEEHIEDEEKSALPHLSKGASPEQAQLLTESIQEFRSAFRFENPAGFGRAETGEIMRETAYDPRRV